MLMLSMFQVPVMRKPDEQQVITAYAALPYISPPGIALEINVYSNS